MGSLSPRIALAAALAWAAAVPAAAEGPARETSSVEPIFAAETIATPRFDPTPSVKAFAALGEEARKHLAEGAPPAENLERIYRFLFKEKRWEASTAPHEETGHVFLSGTLRDGRGSQPALALLLSLLADHCGLPARIHAAGDRILVSVPSDEGHVYLDPARGTPLLSREDLPRAFPMRDGMRESDLLFSFEPRRIPAYLQGRFALARLAEGDAAAARAILADVLPALPLPIFLYGYAEATLETGDLAAAEDTLSALIQNPSLLRARALAQRARIRAIRGDADGAARDLAEAQKVDAAEPLVPYVRGLAAERLRAWREAADAYEAARALAPDWPAPRLALARVRVRLALEEGPGPTNAPTPDPEDRVRELLEGTLSDDAKVADYCAAQLSRMREAALPGLDRAIRLADARIRRQAARLTPRIAPAGDRRAHALLAAALRDPEPDVRREALAALRGLSAREVAPILRETLSAAAASPPEDAAARAFLREAAYALADFGLDPTDGPLCTPWIRPDLAAADATTRLAACRALGRTGGEVAIRGLLAALADPESTVRVAAVEALAALGEWTAVDGLIDRLSDEDATVRTASSQALERITRQSFGGSAQKWTEWWEAHRR